MIGTQNARTEDQSMVEKHIEQSIYTMPTSSKDLAISSQQGLSWMRQNIEYFVEHGEVNITTLAEACAHHFDRDDWLDIETHWVWDIAVKAAKEFEKSFA